MSGQKELHNWSCWSMLRIRYSLSWTELDEDFRISHGEKVSYAWLIAKRNYIMHAINQLTDPLIDKSIDCTDDQPTDWLTDQLINQSIGSATHGCDTIHAVIHLNFAAVMCNKPCELLRLTRVTFLYKIADHLSVFCRLIPKLYMRNMPTSTSRK